MITFDNAGVGFSSGEVPDNVAAMAQYALDFLDALNLTQVDLLGCETCCTRSWWRAGAMI